MKLSDRIQYLRKARGISQEGLADQLGGVQTGRFQVGERAEYA